MDASHWNSKETINDKKKDSLISERADIIQNNNTV